MYNTPLCTARLLSDLNLANYFFFFEPCITHFNILFATIFFVSILVKDSCFNTRLIATNLILGLLLLLDIIDQLWPRFRLAHLKYIWLIIIVVFCLGVKKAFFLSDDRTHHGLDDKTIIKVKRWWLPILDDVEIHLLFTLMIPKFLKKH